MTAIAQLAPTAGHGLAPICSPLATWIARVGAILRQLGPYAAIEILLPGGTLVALLLWLYRRSVYVRAPVRTAESVAYAHMSERGSVLRPLHTAIEIEITRSIQ